jgi:hypothetical protein
MHVAFPRALNIPVVNVNLKTVQFHSGKHRVVESAAGGL